MRYANRKTEEAVDEQWFGRLSRIQEELGETYIALEPTPAVLQREFRAFEQSRHRKLPDLHPDRVDTDQIKAAISELAELKETIEKDEPNQYIKTAYIDAIHSLLANARMVLAAASKDYATFHAENERLYGGPKQQLFEAVCAWIREDAAHTRETGDDTLKALADEALQHIPETNADWSVLVPDETVFHKVRQLHHQPEGFYDYLFGAEGVPTEAYIDQTHGDTICKQLLANIGSDYSVASSENNIWATSRDQKLLLRPEGYRLDRDEFIGVLSHEIGSHVMEVANGSKSRLRLLGLGLAGYERNNEGRAFLREQIVYPHEAVFLKQFAWEYIILLYLAVCLAQGLGGKKYNFAELYKVTYALYRFWRERRLPRATNNEEFAREEAWYLAVRIFKGTTGSDGSYLKDIVYLEGNIACWQLAKTQPEKILLGDMGKFDVTNENHLAALHGLEIL